MLLPRPWTEAGENGVWSWREWGECGALEGGERAGLRDDAGGEGEGARRRCQRKKRKAA